MASERSLAQDDLVAAARGLATGARLLERTFDDMTLPQFRVLGVVASSPERASRIAERAAVSRPSLSGVLDGLESRGWVRRGVVDGDRRGVRLDVTATGRHALTGACAAAGGAVSEILDELEPEDRAAALRGLVLLAQAFERRGARRVATEGTAAR